MSRVFTKKYQNYEKYFKRRKICYNTNMKNYGINKKIKILRIERDMTQTQLAKILNLPNYTISDIERGRTEPDIETIKKLCIFFEISADELLEIDTQEQKAKYINSFNNTTINSKGNIKF